MMSNTLSSVLKAESSAPSTRIKLAEAKTVKSRKTTKMLLFPRRSHHAILLIASFLAIGMPSNVSAYSRRHRRGQTSSYGTALPIPRGKGKAGLLPEGAEPKSPDDDIDDGEDDFADEDDGDTDFTLVLTQVPGGLSPRMTLSPSFQPSSSPSSPPDSKTKTSSPTTTTIGAPTDAPVTVNLSKEPTKSPSTFSMTSPPIGSPVFTSAPIASPSSISLAPPFPNIVPIATGPTNIPFSPTPPTDDGTGNGSPVLEPTSTTGTVSPGANNNSPVSWPTSIIDTTFAPDGANTVSPVSGPTSPTGPFAPDGSNNNSPVSGPTIATGTFAPGATNTNSPVDGPTSTTGSFAPDGTNNNSPVSGPTIATGTFAPGATNTSSPVDGPSVDAPVLPTNSDTTGSTAVPASPDAPTSSPSVAPIFTSPISEGDFTDSSGPFELSESAVVCPGSTPERQEAVWWTYSVTLDLPEYTVEDADGAVEVLELGLRSDLLGLMQCDNVTVGRKLASDYGIVGMDYLPDDIHEEECQTNSSLPCFVYIGSMFIYLQEDADADVAVLEMRKEIQNLMSEFMASSISKVQSVEYLAPDLSNPNSAETSVDTRATELNSSTAIPVLSAVGAVFLMLTLVAVYRFRKGKPEAMDGPSTVGPSTMADGSQTPTNHQSPLSSSPAVTAAPPFTGMLPGVYRQSYPMGAILEDTSDSASYSRNSDILVSESGYTDDDSSRADQSYMSSMVHDDPILGARGMDEDKEPEDDEFLYDISEPPPLVKSSAQKEVRFSA